MGDKNSRRIWFIADPHFGHANILKFQPNRLKMMSGTVIENHDRKLVERFNKHIKPQDVVYFLGDIGEPYHIQLINGTKHLIRGNHDRHSDAHYLKMGFTSVCYETKIKLGKHYLLLSHYPYREGLFRSLWRRLRGIPPLRDNHKRPYNDGKILLHGHIHGRGTTIPYGRQIHVGLDVWDCNPVSWEQISNIINKMEGI